MNKHSTTERTSSRTALESLVRSEIERVLVEQGSGVDGQRAAAAARIAAAVACAIVDLSQRHQRVLDFVQADLPGMAAKFLRLLTAEFDQAFGADADFAAAAVSLGPASGGGDTAPPKRGSDFGALLVEDWAGQTAGSTYLEEHLGISRSTLHRWQKRGDVIALRTGGRKHVFPLAQFLDGRPVPGIREVLASIGHPRQTWSWLIHPAADLDGASPIELLKQDCVADVVHAAKSRGSIQAEK